MSSYYDIVESEMNQYHISHLEHSVVLWSSNVQRI